MTKIIAQRELRNENAKVIDEVVAGESFVVTDDASIGPAASSAKVIALTEISSGKAR